MRTSTGSLNVALLVVATYRRRFSAWRDPEPSLPGIRRVTRAARFTQAIVLVNLVVAALAFAITVGWPAPEPTAFYVLGSELQLANYPHDVAVGETVTVHLGVSQSSDTTGRYRIAILREDKELSSIGAVAVPAGKTWEGNGTFALAESGPDQEVMFQLQREDGSVLRTLRLWIDVGQTAKP